MEFASAPKAVFVDLIWKAELLSPGMSNDTVERQSAILRTNQPLLLVL
jgi:hypothetical protein